MGQSRRNGANWVRFLWLPLLFLLFLLPFEDTRPQMAQVAYDHAWYLIQHGDLIGGQQEAALGYQRFQSSNPVWAAKFKLLLAQAMLYRGMYDAALNNLSSYNDSGNQEGTVQKLAIEAVAFTRQQRLPLADQKLTQAEAICSKSDFAPCGDIDTARAIFDAKQGQFAEARQSFLRALAFAHSHHDSWLEAIATLNLGFTALQVDRFDEAVDWSRSAYRGAAASGYETIMQNAAGNLGWAYFELGDHERALDQFQLAEQSASRLGSVRNELKWLNNSGYVYRDSGDLPRALDCYRKAFLLAKQINSKEDIENTLEDLAHLSVLNGNLKDAGAYIDQVAPLETEGGENLSPSLMLIEGMLAAALHRDEEAEADYRSVWNDHDSLTILRLNAGSELARLDESQRRPAAAEQMYKSTLAAYESARATLRKEEEQLPFGANATGVYDDYIRLMAGQGRTDDALATADQSRARTLEQGLNADAGTSAFRSATINPRRIAQIADATLLFYWLGEKQSYLWTITPARVTMFLLPPREQIAAHVKSYSNAILNLQDPRADGNRDGLWLYNALVAPARALIQPRKPVVIFDDGALSELNFDTLLVPGSGIGEGQRSERDDPLPD